MHYIISYTYKTFTETEEGITEILKVIHLLLFAAVKSEHHIEHVNNIRELTKNTQHLIMELIMEVIITPTPIHPNTLLWSLSLRLLPPITPNTLLWSLS